MTAIPRNTVVDTNISVEVRDSDPSHYRVSAVPNAALGNYVWYDDNVDGLQNSNEQGVSGARVYLLDAGYNRLQDSNGTDIYRDTNSSGAYLFDGAATAA